MVVKHHVKLSENERKDLEQVVRYGKSGAAKINRARILLRSDLNGGGVWKSDAEIARAVGSSKSTVFRTRMNYAETGLSFALNMTPVAPRPHKRKANGQFEAHLIALACSQAPEGRQRWTLELLADQMVALKYVEEAVSIHLVHRTLEKNELKPWLVKQWVIPPKQNCEFVAAMEDVLEVYTRPYDDKFPQVCFDEASKQLIKDTRAGIAMEAGKARRIDYEYEREGTANIFMAFEPLAGVRNVVVTERRTKVDFALVIKRLLDEWYPKAQKVVLVLDNLNTHKPSSLYEAFPPEEARRLIERLEIHYTPKHGSWLNMAETELSSLARQCLNRRIADIEILKKETAAWQTQRNQSRSNVNWRFNTADARIKLSRLYPTFELNDKRADTAVVLQ